MQKREPNEANVRDVLEDVIGFDPSAADWPSKPGVVAPTRELVDEVVEELGWSLRNRHARICVGSIMQQLMRTAGRSPV